MKLEDFASLKAEIRQSKFFFAEITKIIHGEEEATKAKEATAALFGAGGDLSNAPTISISAADYDKNFFRYSSRKFCYKN